MHRIVLTVFCLSFLAIGEAVAQEENTLPGGASSLQETYQDWIVTCVQERAKRCVLLQRTQQDGQQLLAIEMAPIAGGESATGTLVLPFGLALDAGVTLQVDENPAEPPLRFSTCLAGGCIVPLNFDAQFLATLRAGETLETTSSAANSDQSISLPVSLKGFSTAFDRVAELMK